MPDGKTHYKIWKKGWTAPVAAFSLLSILGQNPIYLAGIAGYMLGRWVDPDLDLIGTSGQESRMMKDFKLLGAFFVAWWVPYAYLMRFVGIGRKGHRNFFSHFPVVSTAIRLAWMLLIPTAAIWYFGIDVPVWGYRSLLFIFIGLAIADTFHWAADMLYKGG